MKTVKFLGCLHLSDRNFYLFLAISDVIIFLCSIPLFVFGLFKSQHPLLLSAGLVLFFFCSLCAVFSIVTFTLQGNFHPLYHRFYNWLRVLGYFVFILLCVVMGIGMVIFEIPKNVSKWILFAGLASLATFFSLQINWSITLNRIIIDFEAQPEEVKDSLDSQPSLTVT